MNIRAGTASLSILVQLFNNTTGAPYTGLTFESIGVNISYARAGAARVAVEEATLASAAAAWSSGGFILVDDTNMPGVYRFDVPDAALVAGVSFVAITFAFTGVRTKNVIIGLSMVGTDSAALASAYTAGRAAYLDELAAANLPADLDLVLEDTGTTLPTAIAAIATSGGVPRLSD